MCLISMKYRILILIITIISPGQIVLSYIANTSHTHAHTWYAHTHARTHTPPRRSGYRCSMGRWLPSVTARSAGDNGRCFIQINTRSEGDLVPPRFVCFSRIKNCYAEMRHELVRGCRTYCQSIVGSFREEPS